MPSFSDENDLEKFGKYIFNIFYFLKDAIVLKDFLSQALIS